MQAAARDPPSDALLVMGAAMLPYVRPFIGAISQRARCDQDLVTRLKALLLASARLAAAAPVQVRGEEGRESGGSPLLFFGGGGAESCSHAAHIMNRNGQPCAPPPPKQTHPGCMAAGGAQRPPPGDARNP